MGKGYLIDTNIVIDYLDNKLPEPGMQYLHGIIDQVPNISVITKIELLRFNTEKSVYKVLEDFVGESVILDIPNEVVDNNYRNL